MAGDVWMGCFPRREIVIFFSRCGEYPRISLGDLHAVCL